MTWDNELVISSLPLLLEGLLITVVATMIGIAIALVLGLAVAVVRYARIPVVSAVFSFYVQFIRGTPLLVQAFAVFYMLPEAGIVLSPLTAGILVLGVNYSGYTAEVYRSGIENVDRGQWEACHALSLPGRAIWVRIILPQAVRSIVPMLGNYWIQMFKDSAILSAITVTELLFVGQNIGGSTYNYVVPLTLVGVLFLAVSYPASILIRRLERRLAITR